MTEQGSIHYHCQPPINIPLLLGNPRSSRDLQFTQLRSMWTKTSILSLFSSLFFPLSPVFTFLSPPYLVCYWMSLTFFCWLSLSSLISSHLPSTLIISCSHLSVLHDLTPTSPIFCLSSLIDMVLKHWTKFSRLLWKL